MNKPLEAQDGSRSAWKPRKEGIAAAGLADGPTRSTRSTIQLLMIHQPIFIDYGEHCMFMDLYRYIPDTSTLFMFEHTSYCFPISTNINMYYMSYINNNIITINIYIYHMFFVYDMFSNFMDFNMFLWTARRSPWKISLLVPLSPKMGENAPKIGNTIPVSLRWSNVAIENPPWISRNGVLMGNLLNNCHVWLPEASLYVSPFCLLTFPATPSFFDSSHNWLTTLFCYFCFWSDSAIFGETRHLTAKFRQLNPPFVLIVLCFFSPWFLHFIFSFCCWVLLFANIQSLLKAGYNGYPLVN